MEDINKKLAIMIASTKDYKKLPYFTVNIYV